MKRSNRQDLETKARATVRGHGLELILRSEQRRGGVCDED